MQTTTLVKTALREKSPELYKALESSGDLNEFVMDLADQISSEVVTLTQAQRLREKWDKLGPMECAGKMKMADALNMEIVLDEMLEFPRDDQPDETSLQNQD
jgi:hypothetical protein